MTLATVIKIVLERTGLDPDLTDYKTRARDYVNIVKQDIVARTTWRWLYKSGTITTANGTRSYSLASDVLFPRSFRNQTEDRTMRMFHPEEMDKLDPDDSESQSSWVAAVTGINTTTGYWEVDIIGTPTGTETIAYRYYAFIADFTSSDDATDLAAKFPPWVQPALMHGSTALYKEQKGDPSANVDWERYGRVLDAAEEANGNLSSDVADRFSRPGDRSNILNPFLPEEGSLA